MDRNRLKTLEDKYWKGETNLAEEQELRTYVTSNRDKVSQRLWDLFSTAGKLREAKLDDEFETEFWDAVSNNSERHNGTYQSFHFMRYAAAGIVFLGLAIGFYTLLDREDEAPNTILSTSTHIEDTYSDPEKAFEEAKKALFFASEKLNKGVEPASEIKRFHHTKMSITGLNNPKSDKKE
ncbi:MAG TPA: hypothetical protein VJ911_00025 [Cryomorphaceae bacterium]|nr:hypothetical protein [Cryomorphaceae bacterium]